jgi:hypothetical protein
MATIYVLVATPSDFSKALHEAFVVSLCQQHAHGVAETRWSLCVRDA